MDGIKHILPPPYHRHPQNCNILLTKLHKNIGSRYLSYTKIKTNHVPLCCFSDGGPHRVFEVPTPRKWILSPSPGDALGQWSLPKAAQVLGHPTLSATHTTGDLCWNRRFSRMHTPGLLHHSQALQPIKLYQLILSYTSTIITPKKSFCI